MQVLRSPVGVNGMKRLAAMLVLVAVVCLPLHFHSVIASAQITKECACAHGSRELLGPASAAPAITLLLEIQPLTSTAEAAYQVPALFVRPIRAPPAFATL
jgi:hypothetical protein